MASSQQFSQPQTAMLALRSLGIDSYVTLPQTVLVGDEREAAAVIEAISNEPSSDFPPLKFLAASDEDTGDGPVVEGGSYIHRHIILAVVSAKSVLDSEEPRALRLAKSFNDPSGKHTMGILIADPDCVAPGSDEGKKCLQLAKNEVPGRKLGLGWHVLLRDGQGRLDDDGHEASSGVWRDLSPGLKGVTELRRRLVVAHDDLSAENLLIAAAGIGRAIGERKACLAKLGLPRSTPGQQRAYLGRIASRFEVLARDAVRGVYTTDDAFFGGLDLDYDDDRRAAHKLRSRVRRLNEAFVIALTSTKGCWQDLKTNSSDRNNGNGDQTSNSLTDVISKTEIEGTNQELEEAVEIVLEDSCREPEQASLENVSKKLRLVSLQDAGTQYHRPDIAKLFFPYFKYLAMPWHDIASFHLYRAVEAAEAFAEGLLRHLAPAKWEAPVRAYLMVNFVQPFFTERQQLLKDKLKELLFKHEEGYLPPIFDYDFLALPMARLVHDKHCGQDRYHGLEGVITYYELNRNTFMHNVMSLAVENCLIQRVPTIFPSTVVNEMDDETLAQLAGEAPAARSEREKLEQELHLLERGLRICKAPRLIFPRPSAGAPPQPAPHRCSAPSPESQVTTPSSSLRPQRSSDSMSAVPKLSPSSSTFGLESPALPPESTSVSGAGKSSNTGTPPTD